MTMIRYDGEHYLYKFTLSGGRSLLNDVAFHLPVGGGPGAWMPELLKFGAAAIRRGYYGLREEHLVDWTGPELWLIESRSGWRPDPEGERMVASRARLAARVEHWNRSSMIAFACDAAEHILPAYETLYAGDGRPRAVLAAVRTFLKNRANPGPLREAAKEAEDAAKNAAIVSFRARCSDEICNAPQLDASRAARAAADIAKATVNIEVNAYKPFLLPPTTPEERAWQLKRKLDYINGRA